MGLTRYPHGVLATPNLGAIPDLGWKSDSHIWFVDGGLSGSGNGEDPGSAFLTIQEAINAASQFDVIYAFSKPISSSGTGVTGKYTEHLTITKAKQMLSIIGVSNTQRPIRSCGIYGVAATASPVIAAQAECLTLENLKINFAASNTYGVYANYSDDTTNYGSGLSMYNCRLAGFTGVAAIRCSGLQGTTIRQTLFMDNKVSIYWSSATSTANELLIEDCYFGLDAEASSTLSSDIFVDASGTCNIIINRNLFAHILPTGGTNKYIYVNLVRQGIVANNHFGGALGTTYTQGYGGTGIDVPTNVGLGANYCNGALMPVVAV